ncbi:MAG: DMT family transporter [Bacteroidaceae bacterium]|nr:DMT family transporter [Bacteroidaceae bacterium]
MTKYLYHLVAFLVVAVWGSTFVFTKLLLNAGLTAAQIFVLRFVVAYLLLLVYSLPRKSFRLFASSWKDELLMVALGITGGSLYFLTENSAMIYTTTTNTSLIVCLCPLFAALLIAWFYRSQRLHGIQIVGTVMAAIGVVIVVLNGHFVLHLSPLGDTLAFGACLCWAFYSLLMIPASQRYDTTFITRKVFIYGLLTMIPYFLFWSEMPSLSVVLRPDILANLLFLGCVASMLCYLAWNWVIKKLGSTIVTNYVYFNPVTTVLFAWLILSERITIYFLIGTLLILTGMYLCNKVTSTH